MLTSNSDSGMKIINKLIKDIAFNGFNLIEQNEFEKEEKLFQSFLLKNDTSLLKSEVFINEFYNMTIDYSSKVISYFDKKFNQFNFEKVFQEFDLSYKKIMDIFFRYISLSSQVLYLSDEMMEKKINLLNRTCKISIQTGQKFLDFSHKNSVITYKIEFLHKALYFYNLAYQVSEPLKSVLREEDSIKYFQFLETKIFEITELNVKLKKECVPTSNEYQKIEEFLIKTSIINQSSETNNNFLVNDSKCNGNIISEVKQEFLETHKEKLLEEQFLKKDLALNLHKEKLEKELEKNKKAEDILRKKEEKIIFLERSLSKECKEKLLLEEQVKKLLQKVETLEKQNKIGESLIKQFKTQKNRLKKESKHVKNLENELIKQKEKEVVSEKKLLEQSIEISILNEKITKLNRKTEDLENQCGKSKLENEDLVKKINNLNLDLSITQQMAERTVSEKEKNIVFFENKYLEKTKEIHSLNKKIVKLADQIEVLENIDEKTQQIENIILTSYVNLPEAVVNILFSFEMAGFHVLIVGGATRDLLLGKQFFDIDIITDMPSDFLLSYFNQFFIKENPYVSNLYQMTQFGIKIDVTCCNTDVFFSKEAFINDAEKRAFNINALYCDIKGRVYDPTRKGLKNLLQDKCIELVKGDLSWFEKDPVLLLRAVRIIVDYNLIMPVHFKKSFKTLAKLLKEVNNQKLHLEVQKMFLRGQAINNLKYLIDLDLFSILFQKTSLVLKDNQNYREWLFKKLENTDILVHNREPVSMNYIYALFFVADILLELSLSKNSSLDINCVIDKTINELFCEKNKYIDLEKIKKTIFFFIKEINFEEKNLINAISNSVEKLEFQLNQNNLSKIITQPKGEVLTQFKQHCKKPCILSKSK